MVDGVDAIFSTDARLLVAAERKGRRREIVGVDPARAGVELVDHAVRPLYVVGKDAGGQAEFRSVAALNYLILVLESKDRHHRTEDLLSDNAHIVTTVRKDRRCNEAAAFEARNLSGNAAGDQLRAGRLASFYESHHP